MNLFRMYLRNPNASDAPLGGLQHFKSQALVLDDLAGGWDVSRELGYEASDRSRFPVTPL